MPDLHGFMEEERREQHDRFSGELCLVANEAETEEDDVYVTFPNSDSPSTRERVDYWRPRVDSEGNTRLPQRGDVSCLIELDNGELWLLF